MDSVSMQYINHFNLVLKRGTLSLMMALLMSFLAYGLSFFIPSLEKVFHFFQKYLFSDWEALGFVGMAVLIDTVTGVYAAWRNYRAGKGEVPSSSAFAKLGDKMIIYGSLFVLGHVLYTFKVNGEDISFLDNFNLGAVIFMLLRETWSIIENFAKLGVKLPTWLTGVLKIKGIFTDKKLPAEDAEKKETSE